MVIDDKKLEVTLKNSTYWKHLTPGQVAWVVGLLEGEGTFIFYKNGRGFTTKICCKMTDLIVLQRLKKHLGGWIDIKKTDERFKQQWDFIIINSVVNNSRKRDLKKLNHYYKYKELLEIIKPYFCDRRKTQIERVEIFSFIHMVIQKFTFLKVVDFTKLSRKTIRKRLADYRVKNEANN